jgi:hypothetical protein
VIGRGGEDPPVEELRGLMIAAAVKRDGHGQCVVDRQFRRLSEIARHRSRITVHTTNDGDNRWPWAVAGSAVEG